MTRFDKAREYITKLEKKEYKGILRIYTENSVIFNDEEEVVQEQLPLNKPLKATHHLGTIYWGKPGSFARKGKPWKDVIIAALTKLGITTVEQLQEMSLKELSETKGIKGIAPIIQDSLYRAGYNLKR